MKNTSTNNHLNNGYTTCTSNCLVKGNLVDKNSNENFSNFNYLKRRTSRALVAQIKGSLLRLFVLVLFSLGVSLNGFGQCTTDNNYTATASTPTCNNQTRTIQGPGHRTTVLGFDQNKVYNLYVNTATANVNCVQARWQNSGGAAIGGWFPLNYANSGTINYGTFVSPANAARLEITTGKTAWVATSAILNYRLNPSPSADAGPDQVICSGESVGLNGGGSTNLNSNHIIGTATGTDLIYPFSTYYHDARSQVLILASELIAAGMSAGNLNSIAYDVTVRNSHQMNGFNIKIANTTLTALSTWQSAGFNTVYSANYTVPTTGWQTINFSTPYYWDGYSNIIVETCFDNTGYNDDSEVRYRTVSANRMVYARQDNGVGCNITTVNFTTNIPIIRFNLTTAQYSWSPATSLSATNIATPIASPTSTTTYTLTLIPEGCPTDKTTTVTVNTSATPLTTITPPTPSVCSGSNTTLTASGGTTGSNGVIVWQEGTCNTAYEQNWTRQPFGVSSTTVNSVNGILNVTSTSNDPMILMGGLGSYDPAVYRYINIRYRVTAGTAGSTEIFFYNTTHNYAVGGETGYGTLISDGAWHILSIDMHSDPQYLTGGNILGWRYDWATASGVTMDLDFISLDQFPIIAEGASFATPNLTTSTTYYASRRSDCGSTSCISRTITVNNVPAQPSAISGTTTICASVNQTYSVTNVSGVTYTWSYSGTGTLTGTGNSRTLNATTSGTLTVTPSNSCGNGTARSAAITVNNVPAQPSAISGTTTICASVNQTYSVTNVSGVTYTWSYSGTGTLTGTGNSRTLNATTSGTLTVTPSNSCGNGTARSVAITVNSVPTATITANNPTICHGNTATLSGTVSIANSVVTINNGVGTVTASGTTWSTTITPTATTTYSISSVSSSGCTGTGSGSTTVTLPTAGTTLSGNNESATCYVNGNNYIHFYHSSGRLIASINPNGQNLGNVTATSYIDAGLSVPACDDPTNPNYNTATMGRHWVITPTTQPAVPVLVRLPFGSSEYTTAQTASTSNSNPNDNLTGLASLKLSKYSGTNEDHLFSNNCGNGTTTLWTQSSSGLVNSYISPFNGTDQFASFSITGFSEFWLHGSTSSPLPVTLTNFSATCEDNVTLSWTTASEQNSDRFIVEKSRDGQTWSIVGEQAAAGNSNTILDYNFTDANSWNATSYYRLRQIDFNGVEEVYGPISVSCENKESSMTVYPNPNSGSFTIEIASTEMYNNAQLFLTDLTGKVITSQTVNVANGTTQILINDLDLKMGTYLVTLRGADEQVKPVKVMVLE